MTNLPPATPTRTLPIAETEVLSHAGAAGRRSDDPPATPAEPAPARPALARSPAARPAATQRTALVVLAAMGALAIAFIVLMVVGVTNEAINALAVIATPIASMVAAYYGITLSIQQVKNERAEKERALERADAAITAGRETEVWAAQMESGLRVAMAKLNAARVNTDEVTKAAGTPDDFF
ncbi:hypothetical protein [Cryobacterium tagatosivorans]|uniref:Uncharacterized protein n=1 Tax=Cryobacterium tagatosivorans TaxID=1259199 RepID=A0A4V3I6F4_9MICO|nr:hypothetical protein [Cryobacterium tagatosivorans]TFB50336.1 hypothetical protein E3O23_09770 [Cryobacterium tagatosivorans]